MTDWGAETSMLAQPLQSVAKRPDVTGCQDNPTRRKAERARRGTYNASASETTT